MSPKLKKALFLLAVVLPVVALDQVTKGLVAHYLYMGQTIEVIPGFFDLVRFHNTGGAFGIFSGSGTTLRVVLFLGANTVAAALVLWFYVKTPPTHPWFAAGLCLILGGAAGNMIDRAALGEVVDFLYFGLGGLHWPAFNVADIAVTVGVGILLAHFILKKEPF